MESAADALYQQLLEIQVSLPSRTVIHNQNAKAAKSADEIRELLKLQLFQPVLWVDCVNSMKNAGVDTLIEFGPGKVLTGLTRRIDKSMTAHAVFDNDSFNKTRQTILENE